MKARQIPKPSPTSSTPANSIATDFNYYLPSPVARAGANVSTASPTVGHRLYNKDPALTDFSVTILRGDNPDFVVKCNVTWACHGTGVDEEEPLQCDDAQARVKWVRGDIVLLSSFTLIVQFP